MHSYGLVVLLALTFAVTCYGLEDINGVWRSDEVRKLRGGAATEDDLDEEERAIDIKAGFSKLKNIFKKNPEMTKSLQKLEGIGTTVITKDAAAVRSYIAKNPDKFRRISPGGKKLLISAILSSAFIVVPVR